MIDWGLVSILGFAIWLASAMLTGGSCSFEPRPPRFSRCAPGLAAFLQVTWTWLSYLIIYLLGPIGTMYAGFLLHYRNQLKQIEEERINSGVLELEAGQLSVTDEEHC